MYRELYKNEQVRYADEILPSELTAHYIEKMLEKRNVLAQMTAEQPTFMQRCINWLKTRVDKLRGVDTQAADEVDMLARKFVSTFNLNKGKLTGVKETAYALDKNSKNGYNGIGGSKNGKTATEESAGTAGTGQPIISEDGDNSGRGGISFFNDVQGIRRISEISRRKETVEKVKTFASTIYYKAENEQQADFQALAKDEGIKLYFAKRSPKTQYEYIFDDEMLIIDENMTREQFGEVLRVEKPVDRNIDPTKIAKISNERWDNFLKWKPNSYVTRMSIQDFLDLTTPDYLEQREINARANKYAQVASINDIKSNYKESMYLTVDFKTGKVVDHEGRHRFTELLNAGIAQADIFVVPYGEATFESKAAVEITGQFNDKKVKIGLVRAKSERFAPAIDYTFRRDDGNVRYALSAVDSDGKALSAAQQDYFQDTVVRDKNGRLLTVYHGSPNVFTEFSHRFMNTNGNAHGRGFYFTDDAEYADGFKKDGGQLLKGYLDIRKPASETKVTIRKSELVKLIKAICEAQAQEFMDEESYDNIDDALLDTWVSRQNKSFFFTYKLWQNG